MTLQNDTAAHELIDQLIKILEEEGMGRIGAQLSVTYQKRVLTPFAHLSLSLNLRAKAISLSIYLIPLSLELCTSLSLTHTHTYITSLCQLRDGPDRPLPPRPVVKKPRESPITSVLMIDPVEAAQQVRSAHICSIFLSLMGFALFAMSMN